MLQEQIAITNNMHKYEFALVNLADSQTNTVIPILGGVVNTYLAPYAGYIVGYVINKSAAHSAGSLDFDINVAGTSKLTVAADTTSVYAALNTDSGSAIPFAAGQSLGVDYTSDENLEANSVDVSVTLFVVFTGVQF